MVTTLYLIRHGETEGSETKRYKGSIDVPLSENGIAQVKKTSAFVADHVRNTACSRHMSYLSDIHGTSPAADMLKAVYTSDLGRAIKSGEIVAAPHGVVPVQVTELRERNFGIWEGMSFTEIKEQYPDEFNDWAGNPLKYSPVGGESTLEVKERVVSALERILSGHAGDSISIIAHGGVNRIMLCHILGMPFENIFRIEQDYAAVNVIEFWDRYPVIKLINGGVRG